jgi:hypothetical protein
VPTLDKGTTLSFNPGISRRWISWISLLLFSAEFVGCAIRQGPYSSNVESITNGLQKTFSEFLVPITLSGGSSLSDYPSHVQKSYNPIYVALAQLNFYSQLPQNTALTTILQDLQNQTDALRDHDRKYGLTAIVASDYLTGPIATDLRLILQFEASSKAVAPSSTGSSSGGSNQQKPSG